VEVYVEAEAPYRSDLSELSQFYVTQQCRPNGAATGDQFRGRVTAPEFTMAYNEYRSAQASTAGSAATGYSSGPSQRRRWKCCQADDCLGEMGLIICACLSRAEERQGLSASVIFGFSLLFVFLISQPLMKAGHCLFSGLAKHSGSRVFGRLESCGAADGLGALYPAYWAEIATMSIRRSV